MAGGFHWSLGSTRYFKDAAEVRRTLRVEILPKQMPRGQIVIPGLFLDHPSQERTITNSNPTFVFLVSFLRDLMRFVAFAITFIFFPLTSPTIH
jgi:hypothetical protein